VEKHGVFQQQVRNAVQCLLAASLNCKLLITTARAVARFVFEVVTKEAAELPLVRSLNQREVVFPDIKVFTIGPGRLVPDVRITACTPEKRRNSAADQSVAAVRKEIGRASCRE